MPTARELLEQADALMRRNRAAAADDIPVLTDSVAFPGELSAAAVVPAFTDVAAPAPRAAEHVPTLTEAVAVTGDESVDSVIQEGEPSDWLHLDRGDPSIFGNAPDSIAIVPEVARPPAPDAEAIASTELEEIELTTPAEEAFDDEFEPADTYAEPEAMPPEVAPAATIEAATPASTSTDAWFAPWSSPVETPAPPFEAETPAMQALSAEPFAVPSDASAIETTREPVALPSDAAEIEIATEPVALPSDAAEIEITAEPVALPSDADEFEITPESAPSVPAVEPGGLAAAAAAAAMAAATSTPGEEPAVDDGAAIVEVPAQEETAALRLQETVAAAMSPPVEETTTAAFGAPLPASAPPAVAISEDPAKWDAIAEEIRMQVLQRIDLFTDTGLREQLGMRLKPIVDRASADLVATINLHVGELLRAYVAEAIEREIESWRSNH